MKPSIAEVIESISLGIYREKLVCLCTDVLQVLSICGCRSLGLLACDCSHFCIYSLSFYSPLFILRISFFPGIRVVSPGSVLHGSITKPLFKTCLWVFQCGIRWCSLVWCDASVFERFVCRKDLYAMGLSGGGNINKHLYLRWNLVKSHIHIFSANAIVN